MLLSRECLVSKQMEKPFENLGESQTKWMRPCLRQLDCFVYPLERLLRIAESPQGIGKIRQALHLAINAGKAEDERTVALTVVMGNRHFDMLSGKNQLPHLIGSESQSLMSEHQ